MPFKFSWTICIWPKNPPSPATFEPSMSQVAVGDQIFWTNNDNVAHWPGLLNRDGSINKTYFMPNQIAPLSTSDAFATAGAATLQYACSLHPDEKGVIGVG